MTEEVISNGKSVRWSKEEIDRLKKAIDYYLGYRNFANLFEQAPKNFDRTLSRICKTEISHPKTRIYIIKRLDLLGK